MGDEVGGHADASEEGDDLEGAGDLEGCPKGAIVWAGHCLLESKWACGQECRWEAMEKILLDAKDAMAILEEQRTLLRIEGSEAGRRLMSQADGGWDDRR